MSRPPFNEHHRGLKEAAERSRRKYHAEGWDCEEAEASLYCDLNDEDEKCGPLCLQCRQVFHSMDDLYNHQQADCWVAISSLQFEEEWSTALYTYVRRAVDPQNREPGWTVHDITKTLEQMIMSNYKVRAAWETLDLPQHIARPYPMVRVVQPLQLLALTASLSAEFEPPLAYADVFEPGNSVNHAPRDLFAHVDGFPFVAYRDPGEMLVYTDGSCLNNGVANPRGGCAFISRCSDGKPWPWKIPKNAYNMHGAFFFRLEDVGPTHRHEQPTSNRAELRAAIAALLCIGSGEMKIEFAVPKDQSELVIAMDSTYVVEGATTWSKTWEKNEWRSCYGTAIKNQDLWEELLERVRQLLSQHCAKVSFWHIPRHLNKEADRMAKYAATLKARPRFGVPSGPVAVVEVD